MITFGVRLYFVNKRAARAIGAVVAQLLYTETVVGSSPTLPIQQFTQWFDRYNKTQLSPNKVE